MFLWFAGLAFVLVWHVFRDTAIDYRLVMAGAVLPDVVDGVLGGARVLHTLSFGVVLLLAVMLVTQGRRVLRRQLLAVPIGVLLHLVLDGMWARTEVFWWPFFGWSFDDAGLPSAERAVALVVVQEVVGAVALWWAVGRWRLTEPDRRRVFVRTGRLSRDLVA